MGVFFFSISLRRTVVNTHQEMANRNKRQCRALVRRLQGTLMRLYCADRHLYAESRALASLRLNRSPPPTVRRARSFCGRLASARALLAGRVSPRCRCRRCRSCCSSRRCSGSLNRLSSPLFSNNTKGPVPSGHLYLYNMYIVRPSVCHVSVPSPRPRSPGSVCGTSETKL